VLPRTVPTVNEVEDDVRRGNLGLVHIVEVLRVRSAKEEPLKTTVIDVTPRVGPAASGFTMDSAMFSLLRAAFASPLLLISRRHILSAVDRALRPRREVR
jgi:hypothetical protein